VWIKTSVHHHPNAEDLGTNAGSGIYPGVTLTHWSGFKIEPHNLFRANPLGEPVRCGL
jgi:hypothetical protein